MLLRIGLYCLQRSGRDRQDWILLIDHTIGAGKTKCLLVLGIPLADYHQLGRPLEHHDLEMLALIPVEQSNGAIVHRQLTEVVSRCGVPRAVVSDHGSDLKKGISLLQQEHPEVIGLYDIVHLASRLIEKLLTPDGRWGDYRQACCACAHQVRQSQLAHLKPPRPKTQARYMNVAPEIRWGVRALRILDHVRSGNLTDRQRLPLELVEQKLGWLDEYRDGLSVWLELTQIGQRANQVVRQHGYGVGTLTALRSGWGQTAA